MIADDFVRVVFKQEAVLHGKQYAAGTIVEIDKVFAKVLEKLDFIEILGFADRDKANHAGVTK